MPAVEPDQPSIPLQCLGGNSASAELLAGWRRVLGVPEAQLERFTAALQLGVREPAADGSGVLQDLAAATGIATDDLAVALTSCGFLLRQAARLDLDAEVFAADLARLGPGGPGSGAAAAALSALYETCKAPLRQQGVNDALADHGKLLVGLNWRVDKIAASDRGLQLDADVVFLTLVYRDGGSRERITLQLTPTSLQALKSFCNRFGG
jgi:COMM domain